jgi:Ca2+-binding EF-hand superfamily protein
MPAQEDLQAEFAAFDTNGDAGISPGEARADKYLARSFRMLDINRDGRLQFEEVREWLDE